MTRPSDKKDLDTRILTLLGTQRQRGFELLFHTYYAEVCRHIYRMIPERATVEDIAQEMFSELWRKETQITTSPGAFLHRMAVTRTLNYIRDNKHRQSTSEDALLHKASASISPVEQIAYRDLAQWMTQSIDQLPDRCRQVFVLSRFEQMSHLEIARALDISPKTVENQMTKALKHLRAAYVRFRERE